MCFLSELPPHQRSLFWGDDIILTQAFRKGVAVLTVKEGNPACLLAEIFEDRVIFLGQNPDRLLRVSSREGEFGQHVLLFRQRFASAAVVNNIQRWVALISIVKCSQIVMEPLAGIRNINLRVFPDPGPLLVSLVVPDRGA